MSIPANLPYGAVSIYGTGLATGLTGIVPPPDFLFGLIDQVSMYGVPYNSVGESVLFHQDSVICRVVYNNWTYSIMKADSIVITEVPLP